MDWSAIGKRIRQQREYNGTLFWRLVGVCPNGTPYRYGRTKISPLTMINCSGVVKRSK